MDSNLEAWLNSLTPAGRAKVLQRLGPIAEVTAGEKAINIIRKAAGLPEVEVKTTDNLKSDYNGDTLVDAIRKAAGLKN